VALLGVTQRSLWLGSKKLTTENAEEHGEQTQRKKSAATHRAVLQVGIQQTENFDVYGKLNRRTDGDS
jgi:hypothetical protein